VRRLVLALALAVLIVPTAAAQAAEAGWHRCDSQVRTGGYAAFNIDHRGDLTCQVAHDVAWWWIHHGSPEHWSCRYIGHPPTQTVECGRNDGHADVRFSMSRLSRPRSATTMPQAEHPFHLCPNSGFTPAGHGVDVMQLRHNGDSTCRVVYDVAYSFVRHGWVLHWNCATRVIGDHGSQVTCERTDHGAAVRFDVHVRPS
jgi:hypothetical protein